MAITTITTQVNEKNTKSYTNKKGEQALILNTQVMAGNKEQDVKAVYGSVFLPPFIQLGDVVTVSGEVKPTKSGDFVNYNFNFPTIQKVFTDNSNQKQAAAKQDLFGGQPTQEIEVEDLPF